MKRVTPEHLSRAAWVYVRQSTPGQVRQHHESRGRQYALQDRARQLGWCDVEVVDEDLGRSGAGTLIDYCGLVGCLLADETSVYDPRLPDDRLLLGMKGTMSKC